VLVNARQAAPSRFAARPNPIIWHRASACAGGGCSFVACKDPLSLRIGQTRGNDQGVSLARSSGGTP
jgi:hypothetical protein